MSQEMNNTPVEIKRLDNVVAITFECVDAYAAMQFFDYLAAQMKNGGFTIKMNGVVPCEDMGDTAKK